MTETHVLVVPAPGLGVDGLAHRPQHPQRAQVVLGDDVGTEAHERSDGRGRGVELGHLVPLDHVPVPVNAREWPGRSATKTCGLVAVYIPVQDTRGAVDGTSVITLPG